MIVKIIPVLENNVYYLFETVENCAWYYQVHASMESQYEAQFKEFAAYETATLNNWILPC